MPANKRIDDYIAGYDGEIKRRLEQIYAVIAKVMPSAEQTVSYGMPTFKLSGKNAIHFAAAKHHIGLYPSPEAAEFFSDSLLGYKTSKGAIQFQNNQPLPLDLIQKIAEHRRAKLTGGTSTMKSTRQETGA